MFIVYSTVVVAVCVPAVYFYCVDGRIWGRLGFRDLAAPVQQSRCVCIEGPARARKSIQH